MVLLWSLFYYRHILIFTQIEQAIHSVSIRELHYIYSVQIKDNLLNWGYYAVKNIIRGSSA